ncbi:lactate dehydrogenase [Mameliella alba]|nr:lactate dehydrogenase [Mameliella alba]
MVTARDEARKMSCGEIEWEGPMPGDRIETSAAELQRFTEELFLGAGVEAAAARLVAEALVEAELQGVATHGLLQVPVYLRRIAAGTISRGARIAPVHRSAAVSVYDGGLVLGHVAADQVLTDLQARTRRFGVAVSAVHTATHFGVAGRYARQLAAAELLGIVMCNTRPMLPVPGGERPVVGNNPLAIAVPCAGRAPIVLDMAMSATSMGRVRLAAARGETLPEGMALDPRGQPTTDPKEAIRGILLPAAGAKGFGLALMIDFLCALAGGKAGQEVRSVYTDLATPADCSWLFLALDPSHFGLSADYADRVAELVAGLGAADLPGDRKLRAETAAQDRISLPAALVTELENLAQERAGAPAPRLSRTSAL